MDATKIIVRPATQSDAAMIANVVVMAIGDETALRIGYGCDYLAMFEAIARNEATQYSYTNALIAEIDGNVAGAVVGYDGAKLHPLREGTLSVMREHIASVTIPEDETEAGEYYLDSIAVVPAFRSRGVARALIAAFCDKAFDEGHERVGLIVDVDNPQAESLYSSLGFERINELTFYGHRMWHLQRKIGIK